MKRKRERDAEGIPNLLTYSRVKQNCLTNTGATVLKLLSKGETQASIAKRLGTSRASVCYWTKKLKHLGLITRYEYRTVKQNCAGGPPSSAFDVRFRSLKWSLSKAVNLPYDERHLINGLQSQTWSVRGSTVRLNIGSAGTYSLEIEAGYSGGKTPDECNHKHDAKAVHLFAWLCEHFPELKEASGSFTVNRPGELQIFALQGLAKEILQSRGGGTVKLGDPPIIKVDQSRGFPELQILTENLASKVEVSQIKDAILALALEQKEIGTELRNLIAVLRGPKEPPPDPSTPPLDLYR